MNHRSTLGAVLVVLAVTLAPVAAAVPAGSPATTPTEQTAVEPGERLSGAVAVQGAELAGDVDERALAVRLTRANGSTAKAAVIADETDEIEARLDALEQRKQRLKQARDNGSISQAAYRSEIAELAARLATLRRLANTSAMAAADLPADVLAANGVTVEAIRGLADRAANLSGPEVAAIARSVAGNDVGRAIGSDRDGPPTDIPAAGNQSDNPGNGQQSNATAGDDRGGGNDDKRNDTAADAG